MHHKIDRHFIPSTIISSFGSGRALTDWWKSRHGFQLSSKQRILIAYRTPHSYQEQEQE